MPPPGDRAGFPMPTAARTPSATHNAPAMTTARRNPLLVPMTDVPPPLQTRAWGETLFRLTTPGRFGVTCCGPPVRFSSVCVDPFGGYRLWNDHICVPELGIKVNVTIEVTDIGQVDRAGAGSSRAARRLVAGD